MCIPVQKYKFQYKNKSFGTEKYFLKTLEKIGRYFIYDYYYVPKYMLIIVYLNKTYIFHYYKLSRLYSTKHHLTTLCHTIHPYTSPYVHVQHHAPLYFTIHLYTSPYTPIHHNTPMSAPMYNAMHLYTSPYTFFHHHAYTSIQHLHTPMYKTMSLYTSPYTSIQHHTPMYKTMNPYTSPYTSIQHLTPLFITIHLYTMVMCRGLWLCIGV